MGTIDQAAPTTKHLGKPRDRAALALLRAYRRLAKRAGAELPPELRVEPVGSARLDRKVGTTDSGIAGMSAAERSALRKRFIGKAKRAKNGCIEWTGAIHPKGYGVINVNGKALRAHRVSYELAYGPIPPGLVVRHRECDNRCCVNPRHLLVGTNADNVQDRVDAGRSACKLSDADVVAIFGHAMNGTTRELIAADFGVSAATIYGILSGRHRGGAGGRELDKAVQDPGWVAQGDAGNTPSGRAVEAA